MATRGERESQKRQNELHAQILRQLMQEPENKVCADCPEKGPRWASWNLGIFLCIGCSGIHRNLGVHISKVRSTNLDTWRPEWVESMQKWGNKRANELWEYHLPPDYMRPNGNSSVQEQFIRQKYERAKWKRRAGDPPISDEPVIQKLVPDEEPSRRKSKEEKAEKQRKKEARRLASGKTATSYPQVEVPVVAPVETPSAAPIQAPTPTSTQEQKPTSNGTTDLLGDLFSAPTPVPASNNGNNPNTNINTNVNVNANGTNAGTDASFGDFVSNGATQNTSNGQPGRNNQPGKSNADVMALFNNSAPTMMGMNGMMQPGMNAMQPGMMMQQPGMMMQQPGMMMQQPGMMMQQPGTMQQGGFIQPGMMQQPMMMQPGMMSMQSMQQNNYVQQMQQLNINQQQQQTQQPMGTTLNSNLWN